MHIRSLLPPLRRVFWVLMVVAHAPALVGAWRLFVENGFDAEPLFGSIALTFSMVFFALKVGDVAFLRFRPGRRSFVAFCMVVALVHLDVIRPNDDPTLVPECTVLTATTWLVGTLPLVRRTPREALSRTGSAFKYRPPVRPTAGTVWLDAFRPHCWVLAFRFFSLRAPPA
ncbi:MAG: hypothetical protein WBE26_05455 [Phycisphaerae bacterium]